MGSYVPTTAAEREEMLAAIGVDSLEGLYKAVPQEMLLPHGGLNIPEGLSERHLPRRTPHLLHPLSGRDQPGCVAGHV